MPSKQPKLESQHINLIDKKGIFYNKYCKPGKFIYTQEITDKAINIINNK